VARWRGRALVEAAPGRIGTSSLDEAAPTERGSVRASVTEQTPNNRDSVPLLFGCSVLDLELVPETGGTAMAHELVVHT